MPPLRHLWLTGPFTDQITAYVLRELAITPRHASDSARLAPLWVVGQRLVPALRKAGLELDKVFPTPGSIDGITGRVSQLASAGRAARGGIVVPELLGAS